jgi:CBS domain-containing protein
VATRVVAEGLKPEVTAVSKVMTRNPTFVAGDTLAIEALDKMVQGAVLSFYLSICSSSSSSRVT